MEILNQFGVQPILLAAQVVNFLILLFILKRFLYKPILNVLAERKKRIEDSLKNAGDIELKLEQTNEKIDQMLIKASEEGQKILDESQKSALQLKDEILQKAAQEAQTVIKKAEESVRLEREKMMSEAKEEVMNLVVEVFRRLTGKVLSKEDQRKIIEKGVRNLT